MKHIIKKIIPKFILIYRQNNYLKKVISDWNNGKKVGAPPHLIKQLHIKNLQNKFNAKILVETGTYLGAMVKAQAKFFTKIYTIEVSKEIYIKTKEELKLLSNVDFILGDSGEVLQELVTKIKEPALFWLDGHYSGGITSKGILNTPIYKELDSILNTPYQHVILIDDAQDFKGTDDYPSIDDLKNYIYGIKKSYTFKVKDNMIFILPKDVSIVID
jgi:hypothetical protein